ncbi:MAG: twin-arginine translocase TatA/TatE family subunit [Deltaproteobacteria bacterium]|nr:twin-arginine translocase TatA/TatE family subunit [Deltaproteobacteria bacterium]
MFHIGFTEFILIVLIILIVFGAKRLPELGRGIGMGIRNFRKVLKEPTEIDITPKDREKEQK